LLSRGGVTYGIGPLSWTAQMSHTSASFGDANNSAVAAGNAAAGVLPSYTLLDWSGSLRITPAHALTFGITNAANARYFTKRTGEYPGPGILPGEGVPSI